jgi:hypothetical protein
MTSIATTQIADNTPGDATVYDPSAALFERFAPAALALCNLARTELGLEPLVRLPRPRYRSPWDNVLTDAVRAGIAGTRPRDMAPEIEATAEALFCHWPWESLALSHTRDSQSYMALLEAGARPPQAARRRGRRARGRCVGRRRP